MIRTIDHVNIATQDLAATRDFFVDVLGFEDGPRPDVGRPGHWLYTGGRAILHLQIAREPVSTSRGSAINHVAFEIGDLGPVAAELDRRAIPFRLFQLPGTQFQQMQFEEPNGGVIELICPCAKPAVTTS